MQPKWLPFRLRSCWPAVPGCWTPKGAAAEDTAADCSAFLMGVGQQQLPLTRDGRWEGSFLVYQEELRAIGLAVGGDRGVL